MMNKEINELILSEYSDCVDVDAFAKRIGLTTNQLYRRANTLGITRKDTHLTTRSQIEKEIDRLYDELERTLDISISKRINELQIKLSALSRTTSNERRAGWETKAKKGQSNYLKL